MTRMRPALDIRSEFFVQRAGTGVQLVKPEQFNKNHPIKITVHELLQLPINFYFMDCSSILQRVNDQTAATCGYLSRFDAVGKSIRDVAKKEEARFIVHNDRKVVKTKNLKITDESYTRLDDTDLTAISLKFPWFNEKNAVIGILGCSILMGMKGYTSVTDSLTLLIQTGLLSPSLASTDAILPGLQFGELYFDKRDRDILFLLTRGKTAKETAKTLGLSPRTIEHRLEKIKFKLQASSKSELIDKIIDYFK